MLDLVEAPGATETTPAPWWWHDAEIQPKSPPDNVTYLGRAAPLGHELRHGKGVGDHERRAAPTGDSGAHRTYPTLQLLGPIELVGATGPLPPRAAKQCLEYCAWLLEHPGTDAPRRWARRWPWPRAPGGPT